MNIVWELEKASVADVREQILACHEIAYSTIMTAMKALLGILAVLALRPAGAIGQGTLTGYAFSLDTADPVPEAIIMLKDRSNLIVREIPQVEADENGYFEMIDVPPGSYRISASGQFLDLAGNEFRLLLLSRMFDIANDSVEVNFGFSLAALKMQQELQSYGRSAREARSRGEKMDDWFKRPEWIWPRLQMIRSRIMLGTREDITQTAYADRDAFL